MRRLKSKKLTRAELAVGIGIGVITLLLVGLIIFRKGTNSINPQRCPIDGLPAEWQTGGERYGSRSDHNICNYGHFSVVEKKAHTWWAACQ
jgi:hypothetical protein